MKHKVTSSLISFLIITTVISWTVYRQWPKQPGEVQLFLLRVTSTVRELIIVTSSLIKLAPKLVLGPPPAEAADISLGSAKLSIGLKNSDDQGTNFDLRAEVYRNNSLVTAGQTLCITGVTRNPDKALDLSVSFGPVTNGNFAFGDVLSLKILTRIGTKPDGTQCAGHSNAVGLRFYYDATTRPSRFGVLIPPAPLKDYFLHSGSSDFLDITLPTAATAKFKDSPGVNFKNGNPWQAIGMWSITPLQLPNQPAPSDFSQIVPDPTTGIDIICNEVIVQFQPNATIADISKLVADAGATIVGRIPELEVWQLRIACSGDASGVNRTINFLIQSPLVQSAEPNGVIHGASPSQSPVNDSLFGTQWGLEAINAPQAWELTIGQAGIRIGIVDSGIKYNHEDLIGKIILGSNIVNGGSDPFDDNGHGTSVAGVAAANTNNGKGIAGTCPECMLVAEKVLDKNKDGTFIDVALGVVSAVKLGAQVINASVSTTHPSKELSQATQYALNHNRVVIAAAGNDNCVQRRYPAAFEGVISVGAIDRNFARSVFKPGAPRCTTDAASNFGDDWVHVYAPGGNALPFDENDIQTTTLNGYGLEAGTSFAAPFVSGVAALMLSRNPSLTPGQIRTIMMLEAQTTGTLDPEFNFIRVLDAANAVERATNPPAIVLDGGPVDWQSIPSLFQHPSATGSHIKKLTVTNDESHLYALIEVATTLSGTGLFLDTDNNPSTGCPSLFGGVDGVEADAIIFPRTADNAPSGSLAPLGGTFPGGGCFFSSFPGIPGGLVWVSKGTFVEMAISLDALRTITPNFQSIRIGVFDDRVSQGGIAYNVYSLR